MDIMRFLPLKRLSSGDRIRIYERMRPILAEAGRTEMVARIDEAIAHERYTASLDGRWDATPRRNMFASEVPKIARQVGRALGSIYRVIVSQSEGDLVQDPTAARAQALGAALFPGGLNTIVRTPYVKQVAAVEEVVGRLQGDFAADSAELGLASKVAGLAGLTASFRQAINANPQALTYGDVSEAREHGRRTLANVIALIITTFSNDADPAQRSLRDKLLGLIDEQDQQYLTRRKVRRRNANGTSTDEASAKSDSADDLGSSNTDTDTEDADSGSV